METSEKREQVRQMFNDIAPTYDLLNHLLSLGVDKLWRRRVVRIVRRSGARRILDMATGTGDLALALAAKIKGSTIYGADLSSEMLEKAREKIERRGLEERITLAECDVEHIELGDESVDAATVAFGLRNFAAPEKGLAEMYRTIKRGGLIVVLEFSNPRTFLFKWIYRLYFHLVLPTVGGLVSHNRKAYKYLPTSVDAFATTEEVVAMLGRVGFEGVRRHSLSLGIAQIYVGRRPM